ncbi:hypothetical protein FHS18_005091 [Paenibacillus phyllosphaerae]|uniref:Cof-type HAD-IIB family hydrolase n=1 Tax=Paenibacillus phyllosphaerae TaxID=274593 RepID=A0A7W5B2I0_9BACL|nr:Cof-type HAD-IIB family hydrolase [Paenibacillus phyllosphaerae]MBB3112989.1 hypothetical protein [Paenibacillus phyllosphaerae]
MNKPKLVLFDIDGTLLNDRHAIPDSTKAAVRVLQESGIQTAIATGRSPSHFEWIREELNIDSYVSINGQYVVHKGRPIYENPISIELLRNFAAYAESTGHVTAYCGSGEIRVSTAAHPLIQAGFSSVNLPYPIVDPLYYEQDPVYQGNLFIPVAHQALYEAQFPELRFIRWHDEAVDFLPMGCSKAAGIPYLLAAAGVDASECAAFGDGLNDVEMLTFVGLGIAMGNGVREAKEAAKHVTASSSEDGIWAALHLLGIPQPTA